MEVNNMGLSREYVSLISEKKMSEMAIKGYQNEIATKLKGSMGKDIKVSLEPKEEKKSIWKRIKRGFDNFLSMLQ
jgi:C-terminal processing protease CtpA/Prc